MNATGPCSARRNTPRLALALLLCAALGCARAAEIVVPLTVPFDFLTLALTRQLYTAPGEIAPIWHESECRYLDLDHPQFDRQDGSLWFASHGKGAAGTVLFGRCFAPAAWRGFVEVAMTPTISADWRLQLAVERSALYDDNWKKGMLSGPLWDVVQRFVLPSLSGFSLDLAPPRDEALALLRASVPPADAAQLDAVLRSAVAKAVRVEDQGVVVDLALTVPDSVIVQRPPPAQPEAPLSATELEQVRAALERWDAFLVFVVKGIGADIVDPDIREQLAEVLLDSRYEVLPILAGESTKGQGDPVRALFIETWQRLQEVVREAQQRGVELDRLTRYAAFLRAGDVLLAIDRAAPGLGLEISADGLRRLARILEPEGREDPLSYGLEPDPALRALFGFPPELPVESPVQPVPEDGPDPQSRFGEGYFVPVADQPPGHDPGDLAKRLDRWVPEDSELAEYRAVIDRLLRLATARQLQSAALERRHEPLFGHLVKATALIESCWRQFVRRGRKITYLLSGAGSIGLMQINRYVWRGFYNLEQIKWNVPYNVEAGAEILLHYLRRYVVPEEQTAGSDNLARATYAVYNGGPAAAGRYRGRRGSERPTAVDSRFWEIYRGIAAGGEVDLSRCAVTTGGAGEARQRGSAIVALIRPDAAAPRVLAAPDFCYFAAGATNCSWDKAGLASSFN